MCMCTVAVTLCCVQVLAERQEQLHKKMEALKIQQVCIYSPVCVCVCVCVCCGD